MDDATQLRRRHQELVDTIDQGRPSPSGGGDSVLVKTVTVTTYPTSARAYYGVQRVKPGGPETEGGTPTFTAFGSTFYAANEGSAVPAESTMFKATLLDGRYTFRYDG